MRPIVPKSPRWECKRLTDLARHYACQHCGCDNGTTVAAHSNWPEHGKAGARKSDDIFVAYMCSTCHTWLDQGRGKDPTDVWDDTEKQEVWRRAHDRTLLALVKDGRLKVA